MSRLDYFSGKMFDCCYDYLNEEEQREVIQEAHQHDDRQYLRHLQEEQEEQLSKQYKG